jgi:multiple sugar transport system substrate-binding protein
MRKNQGFHGFISRATCYAKMPDDPAFFFDPDTMDARINNPGFVKALEDAVAILPFSPPDMLNFGFIENAQSFVGGISAMDIQWSDIGPMSLDPSISVVKGNVGFAPNPGCTQTYDARTGEWVEFPDVNYAPYAAFGGWQNVVPTNAEAKEAAIDLAAYLASPEITKLASLTSGSGVNPARASILEDTDAWVASGFPTEEDARGYLDMIRLVQEDPNSVFQLRLPGYSQYQDALELATSKAMSGQATAQEALDEAAAEWNAITDRIGRENQRALYRASIGLTD